jgi:hypothetical protein
MRRSREQHPRALERVRGELVEPDVPVARPVPARRGDPTSRHSTPSPDYWTPPARVDVVHRHVYDAPPPPAPAIAQRRVPVWAIVVAYFAMAIGILLLVLALQSGPIIQPPHTPTHTHHEGTSR